MAHPVAVVDVGSNSIKLLVAARNTEGKIDVLHARTLDARISAGISKAEPVLAEDGMARGVEAVQILLGEAAPYSPGRVILVATSAVRDAKNGGEFRSRIQAATGHDLRIVTGDEEASLIGRGLLTDPSLGELRNFYVFDLGGGSLECLAFRERKLEQAASLQLGCVRLTEMHVVDPTAPLTRRPRYRVMQYVHDQLVHGPFKFNLPPDSVAVGTGGTIATMRAIFGAREEKGFEETDAYIPLTRIRLLLSQLARMPIAERKNVPGLPPARADIFPAALATLIVLADVAAVPGFRHSLCNLRYGLAAEGLGLG